MFLPCSITLCSCFPSLPLAALLWPGWLYFSCHLVCPLQVGLGKVLQVVGELLQYLQGLLVALVYRAEGLRELTLTGVKGQAALLAEMRPVRQIRELPVQIQQLLRDLQELSKILLQLLINATPLYNMVRLTRTPAFGIHPLRQNTAGTHREHTGKTPETHYEHTGKTPETHWEHTGKTPGKHLKHT